MDSGSGGRVDSGMLDAGGRHDGGPAMDSGAAVDAGRSDAGHPPVEIPDAEVPTDSGTGGDAGRPRIPQREHGLLQRIENTTCFVNGTPPLDIVQVGTAPAFASLSTTGAVGMIGSGDRLAVVEKAGRVRSFAATSNGGKTKTVLDLGNAVRTNGLRAAAYRPDGKVLIASYLPKDGDLRVVVARFDIGSDGAAVTASQEVLLTVMLTDEARSGGALAFMFDGTLLVAFGDGGTSANQTDAAVLAGKVARIDVSGDSSYTVPADNPFVSDSASLDEIYALGLGAPTSCSVDRVTGHVWCADIGDATDDHIVLLTPGAALTPILSFTRVSCGAVVGFVSRDAQLPDIQGALVFGDACSATLQGMRFDGSLVRSQADVATLDDSLAAFGEAADGRIFSIDGAGKVSALVRPADSAAPTFPTTVSATGCIADMASREPAGSLIPFEVRTPLWSDGAKKHRFIVLPGQEKIGFTETGAWEFPVGTIFMKEFLLDDDVDSSTDDPIMETRFLIKRSDTSWEGYSYMWDRERKDAFLLEGAEIGNYAMQPGSHDASGASVHRHTFPDRDYAGFVENQLDAMAYIGVFEKKLPKAADDLPRFAQPDDEDADLQDRARSWLYANCSHCHRPGGPTPVTLDFRYETPLAEVNACGVTPQIALGALPNSKIIDPGHSDNSEMFYRLSHREAVQMPPIATMIVDPTGVDAVQKWIDTTLTACP
jgi:hypothetical protein